jgi:hypothetical protein
LKILGCISMLALTASFVACVGCGGVKGTKNISTALSGEKGTGVIRFAIPIHKPGSQFLAGPQFSKSGVRAAATHPRSEFIDSSADGNIVMFLDGQQVLSANFTPPWNGGNPVLGDGPSAPARTTPDGGSISYTSTVTPTEVDVTVNLTTVAGISHVLGIVQLNGACGPDQYGRQLCLGDPGATGVGINTGYVLAEGQTQPFTLQTGEDNAGISLTLQGVLEAGFICDDACDGQTGTPDENGVYHLTAYPVDENGSAVTGKAYSNGWWDIVEMDNQHLVTITTANPHPFNAPNIDAYGWDAQPFTFTCNGTGRTSIAARMLPNSSSSHGPVSGFSYSQSNYPQAGAVLGSVGADQYFGNVLSVQCTTYGSVIITVN